MIIDPDFLDHWKTRLFVDIMEDESVTNCLLRLWFHCQARRTITFVGMTGRVLKAVCRYQGDGDKLRSAMVEAGFIEVDGDIVKVPKFAEMNSKMMASWENGEKNKLRYTKRTPEPDPENTQEEPSGGAEGRLVGRKEGRKTVGRLVGESDQPTTLPCGVTDQTVSERAAEAYQRRRYKNPKPDADYYPALLAEAEQIFGGKPDAEKMLVAFEAQCRAPFTEQLPERATFSDICVAAGLKFIKPLSRGGTQHDKDSKMLIAAQKALAYARSTKTSDADFLAQGITIPREYKLKALEMDKQKQTA